MKNSMIIVFALMVSSGQLSAKIRNGYDAQMEDAQRSLKALQEMTGQDLPMAQRKKVKAQLDAHMAFMTYHELTNELLNQLKTVSPDLYQEIDELKDKRGRPVEVYIKMMTAEYDVIPLEGFAFFKQGSGDEDTNYSGYGVHTVSVSIRIQPDALRLLCHELGHVRYVVPNLASYAKFYHQFYGEYTNPKDYGHLSGDQSAKIAASFEARFRKDYANYMKNGGTALKTLPALLHRIHKNSQQWAAVM